MHIKVCRNKHSIYLEHLEYLERIVIALIYRKEKLSAKPSSFISADVKPDARCKM